jgi:predicted secreted hydrolase
VRAGESWVRGDLCSYELHARAGSLVAQLNLTGIVPSWRPGTGKNYYDESLTRYFAWFPAIPFGAVEGHLICDGKMKPVKGTCYHDHNWGNVGLNEVLSSWYWGRAHVGDFTLIFAEMQAVPRYDQQKIPVFMLAQGSQILLGDGEPLTLTEQDFIADPGGRSYPDGLDLDWQKAGDHVHLKLRSPHLIDSFSLLTLLPNLQHKLASLIANPYYFRFNADLDLQVDLSTGIHTHQEGLALYELMLLR